jgi:hypothetical protein
MGVRFMKLAPDERSILAFFNGEAAATQAIQDLRSEGYEEVRLDHLNRNQAPGGKVSDRIGLGGRASQAQAVKGEQTLADQDVRVLEAATPAVGGMAGELLEPQPTILVTVVAHDRHVHGAVKIIEHHGGRV